MKTIGFILLCSLVISGCGTPWETTGNTITEKYNFVTESSLPYEEDTQLYSDVRGKDSKKENQEVLKEENREFTDEVKADMLRKQQELFYFSNLEITQQNLYVEILYALENYIDEMEVSTTDTDEIDKVFQCVMLDHPEIFYISGYSFVKYALGDEVKKIVFKGTYEYNQEERIHRELQIDEAVNVFLANLKLESTDYEKVKYVYETVIYNTEYDMESADNQNICSVFLNHASVCQGYAKAVQYLLNRLNIPTTLVLGTVENGDGHAWNMVKIDNEYYFLDTTWGDASYRIQNNDEAEMISDTPAISYDYLCVTTEELTRTHKLTEIVPIPICDSLEANYYVREGAYFSEADYEQLARLVERYYDEDRETVTIRCGNDTVYQQMWKDLLEKQKIFNYIDGKNNSIIYTDLPKQRSITFWL